MVLEHYISDLLYRYNCVVVPGFGAFLTQKNSAKIKYDLSVLLKKDLRKVPELAFFLDDSLDYIDSVEDSINNPDIPIK